MGAALRPWLAGPVESHLEAEVLRLLLGAGLPEPTRQLEVMDRGTLVARVDFAWPAERLILEVDGFSYHDGPAKFTDDRHRANRLASLGWTVLSTTQKEVRTDETALVEALKLRLGLRLRPGPRPRPPQTPTTEEISESVPQTQTQKPPAHLPAQSPRSE